LHTRLCISKRMESTTLSESVYSTEHWLSKQATICCGFGLGLIQVRQADRLTPRFRPIAKSAG
ncbi:MAG TPA: hypothetical protein VFR80_07655, partial [Pyrinomonadaceae bacterium]|nr:hypothetical protein [Pyrinomonadaceae bacterium]